MERVTSKDSTNIAFDQEGNGLPLILVDGALGTRGSNTRLVELLAPHFTVINYDRRGRGDSGDTQPYAVEREIEDIAALIEDAGGSAFVYGISSGAILALRAANKLGDKVKKLAVYEPPFILDDSRPPLPADYVAHLNDLIAEGRRGDAVSYFLTAAIGLPEEWLPGIKSSDNWPGMENVAHTLAYDGAVCGDTMSGKPLPQDLWSGVTAPTLVMNGGNSEEFFNSGALALTAMLADAQHRVLAGQDHNIDTEVLAPVLIEYFGG